MKEHEEIGNILCDMSDALVKLSVKVGNAYPKTNNPFLLELNKAISSIAGAKSKGEAQLIRDFPDAPIPDPEIKFYFHNSTYQRLEMEEIKSRRAQSKEQSPN